MKKVIIFALCILGICNAHAETMTAQEIILTQIATMFPWDSKEEEKDLTRPDTGQTDFHASIDGNHLSIGAYTGINAYAEVVAQSTGDVVAAEEFTEKINMYIPQSGDYELYIYSELGTVMAGEFSVQ